MVPAEHNSAPLKVFGEPVYAYDLKLEGGGAAEPQTPFIIPAPALVAGQSELEAPPFEPPHVHLVVPPWAGKPEPETYVTTPLPAPHIAPEKAVSVER